jgi:uncharacterized protein (DUF433 family)
METTSATALANPPASPYIEVTSGVCGGQPRIVGTRIRVQDVVVWHERFNWSADEICSKHPQVTLAGVYAALSYYHDHRAEIDQHMEQGRKRIEELRVAHPSKLTGKIASQDDG